MVVCHVNVRARIGFAWAVGRLAGFLKLLSVDELMELREWKCFLALEQMEGRKKNPRANNNPAVQSTRCLDKLGTGLLT